jgi:hypothetical protein
MPIKKKTMKKTYKFPIMFYFEEGHYYIHDKNVRQFGLVKMTPAECKRLTERMFHHFVKQDPNRFHDRDEELEVDKKIYE